MTLHAVVAGWLLGPPSGANRRLLALLQHTAPLLVAGERITVLHRADHVPPSLPGIGWQPIAIPAAPTWRRALAERRLLPAALRALGATVVDHGFLPLPPLPVPSTLIVHDLRAVQGLTGWPRPFARALLRRSCARAAAVITPSAWTAARLRELCPGLQPVVIHNGVELPSGPLPDAPDTLPSQGYLLHTGHLEARKNLGVVVQALATLPAANRPELWLAGADAGAGHALQRQAVAAGVVLRQLGVVDDVQLAQLYAHARTVVMPSHHEGFGLPALEALAHGRPLLVAAGTALPEVSGDLATILPADDPAAWALAIAAPPADDTRARAARVARAATFDWPRAARQWLTLWRQLDGTPIIG
ncbi:MAG: glycosyltransferase [Planctomycetes bacterium]|jgi:glycosyltransferase involved in cell wall biosynthesis|nr:glycosyltransferase [Planctomycetota bacterium]